MKYKFRLYFLGINIRKGKLSFFCFHMVYIQLVFEWSLKIIKMSNIYIPETVNSSNILVNKTNINFKMWLHNPFDNTSDSQAFESFGSTMNGHQMFIINLHSSYFLLYSFLYFLTYSKISILYNQNKTQ